MKKSNLSLMLALALSALLSSCQKAEITTEKFNNPTNTSSSYQKILFSFVQSSNFDVATNKLASLRKFNSNDNQIASVSVTDNANTSNALLTDNNDVIVFESMLPEKFTNLSEIQLAIALNQIVWQKSSFNYVQSQDIIEKIENNGLTLSVREAGSFAREEGLIDGLRVFKFKNNAYKEDYRSFVDIIDDFSETEQVINLVKHLNIQNSADYQISSTSEWFKIENNSVVLVQSASKPTNTFGMVYLKSLKAGLPSYRLRLFSHRVPTEIQNPYFKNGQVIDQQKYSADYLNNIVAKTMPACIYLNKSARETATNALIPPIRNGAG